MSYGEIQASVIAITYVQCTVYVLKEGKESPQIGAQYHPRHKSCNRARARLLSRGQIVLAGKPGLGNSRLGFNNRYRFRTS